MSHQACERMLDAARRALDANRHYGLTVPHLQMFRAGYLWDIAVTAKGLAVHDPTRAADDLLRYLQSQWSTGMLPNEAYFERHRLRARLFGHHPHRPHGITTSGITQPPMILRSVLEVGRRLDREARPAFYAAALPPLVSFCHWLLRERTGRNGLVVLIHPYESGMDNRIDLAEWMAREWPAAPTVLGRTARGAGIGLLHATRRLAGDCRGVPIDHRSSNVDLLAGYQQTRHIRRLGYDLAAIHASGRGLLVEEVGFNAVLLDGITCLLQMLDDAPPSAATEHTAELQAGHSRLDHAISGLWVDATPTVPAGYYSRDYRTGQTTPRPTVAGLFPLLTLPPGPQAHQLIQTLVDPDRYWTRVAPPSAPADSRGFHPDQYWRGATWPFPVDILETALHERGERATAAELRHKYLHRPAALQHAEYDNPVTGAPRGARPFSPSAAVALRFANR